jgi:MOSC domain-containing protein YiiM
VRLEAISLGTAQPIGPKRFLTGIFKAPQPGPVHIGEAGIATDAICDRKYHGGADQALYLYFRSDYDYFTGQLQVDLPAGSFGENLTIEGFDAEGLCVGDRFVIGDVVIEATAHRTPCMTFALKMDDPHWVKRFFRAGRPGAYCRVIAEGEIKAGMAVEYVAYEGERIRLSALLAREAQREPDMAFIERALTTPLSHRTREDYEALRARLF